MQVFPLVNYDINHFLRMNHLIYNNYKINAKE